MKIKTEEKAEAKEKEVLEFIERRFSDDCNWTTGNCYYFALILKDRFPEGKIFYDVRLGHFAFHYYNQFYDWTGVYKCKEDYLIPWDTFGIYDASRKQRIIQDCIM